MGKKTNKVFVFFIYYRSLYPFFTLIQRFSCYCLPSEIVRFISPGVLFFFDFFLLSFPLFCLLRMGCTRKRKTVPNI